MTLGSERRIKHPLRRVIISGADFFSAQCKTHWNGCCPPINCVWIAAMTRITNGSWRDDSSRSSKNALYRRMRPREFLSTARDPLFRFFPEGCLQIGTSFAPMRVFCKVMKEIDWPLAVTLTRSVTPESVERFPNRSLTDTIIKTHAASRIPANVFFQPQTNPDLGILLYV